MLVETLLEQKQREIITTTPSTSIEDAMDLLITKDIGCLPVLDDDTKLIGIISDKDIFKKLYETKGDYHNLKVEDIMSTDLIIGVLDDELDYIASVMDTNWIQHMPIVDGEKMVGIISQRDIIKVNSRKHEQENRYLNLYMEGLHKRDQSGDV
ncbi:MAG: CBS domain-containing protein [candidate division Zixibacteria bacterium]|nr:CBS domain-containing protein [candidate division Zixibacteria bacterium]